MMRALAEVTKVTPINSSTDSTALFKIDLTCEQQTSCNSCASKSSCATGQVTKAIGNKQHQWHLVTTEFVKAGDVVEIGLPEKALLSAAAVVYLVPLFALLFGALLGNELALAYFNGQEWVSIVTGFGAALISGTLIRAKLKNKNLQAEDEVTLIRVLGQSLELK
jgi:sigma-E factor negative regulatory protein RseC